MEGREEGQKGGREGRRKGGRERWKEGRKKKGREGGGMRRRERKGGRWASKERRRGQGKWGFPFLLKHLHPISTCPEPEHWRLYVSFSFRRSPISYVSGVCVYLCLFSFWTQGRWKPFWSKCQPSPVGCLRLQPELSLTAVFFLWRSLCTGENIQSQISFRELSCC